MTKDTETGTVQLPFGFKFTGLAAKAFMQNLGWVAALASMAYALYGPPNKLLIMVGSMQADIATIKERLNKIEAPPRHERRQADEAGIVHKGS